MNIIIEKTTQTYRDDNLIKTVFEVASIAARNTLPITFSLVHKNSLPIRWMEPIQAKHMVCGTVRNIFGNDAMIYFDLDIDDDIVAPLLQSAIDEGIRLSSVITPSIVVVDDNDPSDFCKYFVDIKINVPDVGPTLLHSYFYRLYNGETPQFWYDMEGVKKEDKNE